MATSPPSNPGALVLDANVVIAICSAEIGRDAFATGEITDYVSQGFQLYAPGVVVAEVLFVLCGKRTSGSLSLADYASSSPRLSESWLPFCLHPMERLHLSNGPNRSAAATDAAGRLTDSILRL